MLDRSFLRTHFSTILLALILMFGFAVRLRQYVVGVSLWLDEAALALNIIHKSAVELLQPLDYLQGSPTGFLWLVKAAVSVGNEGEYWLRLVPLLAGLLSLVLFPLVARHYLSRYALLLALLLLAISERLIYYSTELKQYSLDVLLAIGGLALFLYLRRKPLTIGRALWVAVVGSLMLWLSHPAVFVLGGIGLTAMALAWRAGERQQMALLAAIGAVWLICFAFLVGLTLSDLSRNEELLAFWHGGFPPPLRTPIAWLQWHWGKFNALTGYPLGLVHGGAATLALLVGSLSFYRRDKAQFFSLVGPILLVWLAAILQRYPFADRMILFTAPMGAILVARGVEELVMMLRPISRPLAYAVPIWLLFAPVMQARELLRQPYYKEQISPVLAHVRQHWQEGDHIYVYYSSNLPFQYYRERFGFGEDDYTLGVASRADWMPYFRELDALAAGGGRVWMVFSHVYTEGGANEEKLFTNYLSSRYRGPSDFFSAHYAAAYLFDFR
jgi:hypothetical protein